MSFGASQIKRLIHNNNYWDMLMYPMKIIAHLKVLLYVDSDIRVLRDCCDDFVAFVVLL